MFVYFFRCDEDHHEAKTAILGKHSQIVGELTDPVLTRRYVYVLLKKRLTIKQYTSMRGKSIISLIIWVPQDTRGLSNVVLKGITFSVLDEWVLGCSNAKKVADLFKAVIFWGCHCSESLKYKQLADEILATGSAMVAVFKMAQDFEVWTSPNYTYDDMNVAIDELKKLHLHYKTKFQLDRPSASAAAAGTAEAADGHQFGGQAADNDTSSAMAAAAGTAAEAA